MKAFGRFASFFGNSGGRLRKRREPWHFFGHVAAETCEARVLLSGAAPAATPAPTDNVNVRLSNGNVTLQDSDGAAHSVEITRSGNNLVFSGMNGTTLSFQNGPAVSVLTVAVPVLKSLTANMGAAGGDALIVNDVSVTGAITVNGSGHGALDVELSAVQQPVTVGGAIHVNSAGQQLTFELSGLGENFTVNGAVQLIEGGGPQVHNLVSIMAEQSGHVLLRSGLAVTDSGTGADEFDVLGGVTINCATTLDARTTQGADVVNLQSISPPAQAPVFNGTVNLLLGNGPNAGAFDSVIPIQFNGAFVLTSGRGGDSFVFSNDVFKQSFSINSGSNPVGQPDVLSFDQVVFDGPARVTTAGPGATVNLATAAPVEFKSTAVFVMTGPSSLINAGQPSTSPVLVFDSTLVAMGGKPFGTLRVNGGVSLNPAKRTLTNFNIVP